MASEQEIKELISALKNTLKDTKGYSDKNIENVVKQLTAALKNTDSKDIEKIFKEIIPDPEIWNKVQKIADANRIDRKEVVENKVETKVVENKVETPDEVLKDNERFSQYDDVDMQSAAEQKVPSNTPKKKGIRINPADKHNIEYIVKNLKNITKQSDRKAWVGKQPQYIQDIANKYKETEITNQMNLGKENKTFKGIQEEGIKRTPLTSDFTVGIPDYGKKIPDNTVKVWNLGRKIHEKDIDLTKKVDGKSAVGGWEPNLIGTGHQEGILIHKELMEKEWLIYGKEPPSPGERIVHGFENTAREHIKNIRGGIESNYGIAAEVTEVEELTGKWFNDNGVRNKIAKEMGITPQALEELVISGKTGAEKSVRAGWYEDKWSDAYFVRVKPLKETDITDLWINAEEGVNVMAKSELAAAQSWGFNSANKIEIDKLLKGAIPLMGMGVKKGAKVLDYGETIYGWMANGIGGALNKLGTPGKAVAGVVGQGAKKATITAAGTGVAAATAAKVGVKGAAVVASTGSVAGMAAYEKYNFLYGMASGIILSAIETLGIITKDTFGETSIKNALGPEYEKWAESNGIIDKVGVYPLINSLEEAEAAGVLSTGFVDEYTNWTNDKWINVLYEFLGTEGYEDMESINTVWREKRKPQNWFGSLNEVFGLNSGTALMNAGFIPETGLMPAIKRSPIITGIEIPFENWLLPKIGLEDWVYPEDDFSDETQLVQNLNNYGDIAPVDQNAWLGNMASMGDVNE